MRSQKLDSVYTCGHKISRKQFLHMRSQKLAQTVSTHAVTDVHGSVMLRCRARSLHWVTVNRQDKRQRVKADSTLRSSQAVPHPSTDRALRRLTSEVERDPVHSTWYGCQRGKTHSTNNSLCGGAGLLGRGRSWGCAIFAPVDGGGWGWCHPPFVLGRQDWPVLQEVELRHCGCVIFRFLGLPLKWCKIELCFL